MDQRALCDRRRIAEVTFADEELCVVKLYPPIPATAT
jgi:hypothetical protein